LFRQIQKKGDLECFQRLHLTNINRRIWEAKVLETLDQRPNKKCDYILLRSEQASTIFSQLKPSSWNIFQLVGTALMVIVRSELTGVIRNVEAASRKVGFRFSL
jgi:hypothetical protein